RAPPTVPEGRGAPTTARAIGRRNSEPPMRNPFEGDVAIKEMRHRLSLDPDLIPQPPRRVAPRRALPWIGRLLFVLIVAAVVIFAVALMALPPGAGKDSGGIAGAFAPMFERWSRPAASAQPARLVVESQRAFANEPIALGVSLADASGEETLIVIGLADGTRLSAGRPLGPTGCKAPPRDWARQLPPPPRDFSAVMDRRADLRRPPAPPRRSR